MESKGIREWSSLVVPSVQELVKENNLTTVPPRYVRSEVEGEVVSADDFGLKPEIPIIDFKNLRSETTMDAELKKLDFTCREWGVFHLVNHGVDLDLLEKVKAGVHEFFYLPMEEKKKLWQRDGDLEGYGQAFVLSDDQKLDWADMFYLTTHPVPLRRPHLFPKLPLPFRDLFDTFTAETMNIAKILIAKMASALNLKKEEMEDLFEEMWQTTRMNYYPPCPQPDKVIGLTPHSDAVALTLLLHVNEVEGLQIRKDGKWVPVKPLPNAFVVNIGDIIEIITNGEYRTVEHRAMVNGGRERLSLGVFQSPCFNTEIGPAPSLVGKHGRPFFRTISTVDYFNAFFSRELKGKTQLQLMRI